MKEIAFNDKASLEAALQEKQLMSRLSHRNVCKYFDSFIANGNKLYLIMEYCDKGDLKGYLSRLNINEFMGSTTSLNGSQANLTSMKDLNVVNKMFDLGEHKIWKFFIQICLALEVIHEKGIVHADLKP